jgi:dTDP-4-amino-4,6-dideoxygalactose transaminase
MKYTLINPSFDAPKGETKELLDKLAKLKQKGENEGGDEIAALAGLFLSEDLLPNVNYLNTQEGPIFKLCREFLAFICSFKSVTNPVLAAVGRKYDWNELPLFASGIQSATAGLTASLMAGGIDSGEVITTSLNFTGVPNAIIMAGATPKFADIDPENLCMDVSSLEKTITKNTKAVILVHFNQVVDLMPVFELLEKKGLNIPVIQDASLAMGSSYKGLPAGLVNLGKNGATVFSFATSKIISGLGGSIVLTNDRALSERIQAISYQGWDFANIEKLATFGSNFKMNDMNAAIVLEQLKKRDSIFEKRRQMRSWYDRELADVADSGKIAVQKVAPESIITHYAVLLPDRRKTAVRLAEKEIAVGFWHCAHLQKIYCDRFKTKPGTLPVTESLADRITFLPFHTKLTEEDVKFICRSLKEVL